MATAPTVQSLDQIIADLNPAYQGSVDNLNAQISAVPAKYDSQRTALTAAKGAGFNAINSQAVGKGLAFSGIPADEQAQYLSTKYLPGMQAADQSQNADVLQLQGSLASLNQQKYTGALQTRQTQQSALDAYLQQQAQQEFQAQQAALDRALSAANSARSAASSGGGGGTAAALANYTTKSDAKGGTQFLDPNGNAITAAQYFNATGGGAQGLGSFLSSDKNSSKAYADFKSGKLSYDQLVSKYPYIFQS